MRLHALHDAATVARLAGADLPSCETMALDTDDPSHVLFSFVGGNPLGPGWLIDLDLPGDRIACWSGTLDHDSVADGELFSAHPHNWMSPGTEALDSFLDEMIPGLERHERTLCLIPHARHVLSDVQGSINLIRARGRTPIEIALAPVAMLTASMLETLEEHLERAFETLSEHAPFLYLHDAVIDEERDLLIPVPLGSGILDRTIMQEAIRRHWPEEKPVVIPAGDLPEQTEWLLGA